MARSLTPIATFVQQQIVHKDEEDDQPTQSVSIRLPVQVVGDLEDLAGRLDLTRSMLARRLIEAGLEEAEAEWDRLERGKG